MNLFRSCFFFLAITALVSSPAVSADFLVTNIDDSGGGSLRDAIASANGTPGDDTITFDTGLSGDFIDVVSGAFVLTNPGRILISAESLSSPVTIFAFGSSRLFEVSAGVELELRNLVLSDGQATPGDRGIDGAVPTDGMDGEHGGAIFNEGTLILYQCSLTGNEAGRGGNGGAKTGVAAGTSGAGGTGGFGGAIYSTGVAASVSLESCSLVGNKAGVGGSGGNLESGAVGTITEAAFGGNGGAIFCNEGVLVITNSSFQSNQAGNGGSGGLNQNAGFGGSGGGGGNGGAVAFQTTDFSAVDSTFRLNVAGSGGSGGDDISSADTRGAGGVGGDGGAIWGFHFVATTTAHLSGVLLEQNRSGNGATGGSSPELVVSGVGTDGGNGGNGGGLFLVGNPVGNPVWKMQNSTVALQLAGSGGTGGSGTSGGVGGNGGDGGNGAGIAFSQDGGNYTAVLSHVTVVSNEAGSGGTSAGPGGSVGAGSSGGGIWEFPGGINGGPGVTLANSVVATNDADTIPNLAPGFLTEGNNVTSGDPLLGDLSDNGGPTFTIAPLRGSSLINSGGTISAPLITDQRGAVRPFNGVADIGAFEVALQPDGRIGSSSNPATHRIDDVYTSTGAGQSQTLKFKAKKSATFYLSMQNDGEIADDITLTGTAANRTVKLAAYSITGERENVTAALILGYTVDGMLPGDVSVFQVTVKGRSKKKPARQTLSFQTTTAGVPLPDTSIAKVIQKKPKKKKRK
jgi:hypothetical protein